MTQAEMQARIVELERQNAALQAAYNGPLTCKVSPKGGVSIRGFGRWPVTLYADQLDRLFRAEDQVRAFIAANRDKLKTKAEAGEAADCDKAE